MAATLNAQKQSYQGNCSSPGYILPFPCTIFVLTGFYLSRYPIVSNCGKWHFIWSWLGGVPEKPSNVLSSFEILGTYLSM